MVDSGRRVAYDAADDYYKKHDKRAYRMPLRGFIAAFVLGVLATQARAADLVGYAEAYNVLYSIDLTTRAATMIGAATVNGQPANLYGLAARPGDKTLYAVSDAGAVKTLVTIDAATGSATPVGTLDLGSSEQLDLALAFTSDGRLWMSAYTGQLWSVNPATAATTPKGSLGVTLTGLAARGLSLYGAGGLGNNNLYSIDTAKGQATLVGAYGIDTYITTTSPAFDASGNLWAIFDYVPPKSGSTSVADWSDLTRIQPGSGATQNLGNIRPSSSDTQSPGYQNLWQIGLRGLAIPAAAAAPSVASTPTLSWPGLAALIAMCLLLGGTTLRQRRQTRC